MKINLNAVLYSVNNEPLSDGENNLILRHVIQNALLGTLRGDENMEGKQKVELWDLAKRAGEEEADYTVEEVAIIRQRIGRAYGPVVVGPAFALLG